MKHPLAMDLSSSDSDASSEEEDFIRVQNLGSRGKRVRTYSKTGEGKPLKKGSRVAVAFKEDNWWENILDKKKSRRRENTKEEKSNKTSTEEKFFLFQSKSREEVGNHISEEKKSVRGKRNETAEDVTPKKPKKLPLAPASKSPTEEDCSYGWQQSCWRCSRRSAQLRLCSACQVAAYCSTHCQKEAWPDHEERCKIIIEREECEAKASPSTLAKKERLNVEVKKVKGKRRTVKESPKAQADNIQTAAHGEVGPGGEVFKTVSFNSQPQFAPSQEMAHFIGDEEARPGGCLNIQEVRSSPLQQPKSILKTVKVSTPKRAVQCPVKSPPIDLTGVSSSPSQSNQTPPSVEKQAKLRASSPTSPTQPSAQSALKQVKVTPPNSPSLLASVQKSSQAKPKSDRRRSTPYPQGAHGVKLVEEVDDEEERLEVDEEEESGADVEDKQMEVEDQGLWLKPQRLDFADISELDFDFDSNYSDQEGSICDELNTVQEIQFSSQSTEERGRERSPDMFSD